MALIPTAANGNYRTDDEDKDAGARGVFAQIRERETDARQDLPRAVKSDPDTAARARKAALFTGTSAEAIQKDLPAFEQDQRVKAVSQMMERSERMRRWFTREGAAEVSHDDTAALNEVAQTYEVAESQGWLATVGDWISGTLADPDGGGASSEILRNARDGVFAQDAAKEEGFFDRMGSLLERGAARVDEGLYNAISQVTGSRVARSRAETLNRGTTSAEVAGNTTWEDVKDNPWAVGSYALDSGVESLPYMLAAGTPFVGLGVAATSQTGNIAADRAQNNGKERGEADIWDFTVSAPFGIASAALDRLGIESIFGAAGKSAARRIVGAGVGEGATEFAQSGVEYAGGTLGTDAGFDWREGLEQSFAGAIAGAPMGSTLRAAQEGTLSAATRAVEFAQARAGATLTERIFKSAAKSKLRLRDPELFAEFLANQAEGSAAENLYVTGSTLRSLFQDENGLEIDRGDDAVSFEDLVPDFWDQLAQADATGGDVVIPMARAAAYLAGTPEWEIIKGDARVAPGGITPNEARALEGDWAGVVEDLGRRAYAAAQEDVAAEGPRSRVYQSVLEQARSAGFSTNASRAYADLWAERYQARAERLTAGGVESDAFTLFEQSLAGIQQAVPGTVQTYRGGDGLDVLINAMRKGAEEMQPEGQSLIDRIIDGGGIADEGGDIASMGGGKIQKGGFFGRQRKPLIRDAAGGDMLDGGFESDYSLDTWAQTLWDEGYFGTREERPDINELIDLLGDALRGNDVFPQATAGSAVEANNDIVTAADDLRQVIINAGLDPEAASREEIEAAIDAYQEAEAGERGLAQANDAPIGLAAVEAKEAQLAAGETVAFETWGGGRVEITREASGYYDVVTSGSQQSVSPEDLAALAEADGWLATSETKAEASARGRAHGKILFAARQEVKEMAGGNSDFENGYLLALSGRPMPESYLTEGAEGYREGYDRAAADGRKGDLRSEGPAYAALEAESDTPRGLFQSEQFAELMAQARARIAAREAAVERLVAAGGSVRMISTDGRPALVGPDMAGDGAFRVTYFDAAAQPTNHTVHNTMEGALQEALQSGYQDEVMLHGAQDVVDAQAGITPKRLRAYLDQFGYGMGGDDTRSKATLTRMSPADFLSITVPVEFRETFEGQVEPLDPERLAAEIQPIMLQVVVDEDGSLRVYGHEGRHRMAALRDAGITSVPVVLKYEQGAEREISDGEPITAQAWVGWHKEVEQIDLGRAVPLAEENKDLLREEFGGGRVLFQDGPIAEPDAKGRPLVTVHNLSAENFRNAEALGALAAPSIAVIRADLDFASFGEITLIARPDMADPRNGGAAFNADVYSPRQPRAQFDLNRAAIRRLEEDLSQAAKDAGEDIYILTDPDVLSREGLEVIMRSGAMMLTYLRSIGQDVRPVYRDKTEVDKRLRKFGKRAKRYEITQDEGFIAALTEILEEQIAASGEDIQARLRERMLPDGVPSHHQKESYAAAAYAWHQPREVDKYATFKRIEKRLNATKKRAAEFDAWAHDRYSDLIAKRFFEKRDSGRRQDYTLDNIVREMTRTIRDGEGFNYGLGSLRSNVAKQFRSLEEIKANRDGIVDGDAMDKVKAEVGKDMYALADKFAPYHGSGKDFGWTDIFSQFLKDLAAGRPRDLREWQEEVFSEPAPEELLQEARDFLTKLRGLPTEYFEVKMQRAVQFDEFAAAVVPQDTPADVIKALQGYGLKVEKYDKIQAGGRVDAISRVSGAPTVRALFQSAWHGSPYTFDAFSTDFMGKGEGAQAFGWGLYFTNNQAIAAHYRDVLSKDDDNFRIGDTDEIFNPAALSHPNIRVAASKNGTDLDKTIARAEELLLSANETTRPMLEEDLAILGEIRERGGLGGKARGRIYEVDIPEDHEFMRWDRRVSEQPDDVRAAMEQLAKEFQSGLRLVEGEDRGRMMRGWSLVDESGEEVSWYRYKIDAERDLDLVASDPPAQEFYKGLINAVKGRALDRLDALKDGQPYNALSVEKQAEYDAIEVDYIHPERAASLLLLDAGVRGNKYPAGTLAGGTGSDNDFNYVVFDAADVRIGSMDQESEKGPRARIDWRADKRAMITLFERRDLSSLLHEGGHLWLEELRADALALQDGQVFADWETAKAWMKRETGLDIPDNEPIPTEAHEKWADATERYMMEGKAPSLGLERAFSSFRAWMKRIYKVVANIRGGQGVEITDEVRQVFDRLIATDEAIEFAQREGGDRALFDDAAQAGMTEAEYDAYVGLIAESRSEAHDKLLERTMERVRISRTKEYKERRKGIRAQVEKEIRERPEWRAVSILRGDGDEYMPVSRESVIQRVGNDAWEMLPYGRPGKPTFTNEAFGFDVDLVAERAGFQTGTQMLETLMGIGARRLQLREANDRRTVLDEAIDVETERRLTQQYGDVLADGSIEAEALEIIHTDAGAQRLAAEVRQLAIKSGDAPTPSQVIREWAERVVGEARIVDQASGAAVDRHRRAEAKAGRAAEQAYLSGDFKEAFQQKQKQQIANALFRASRDARDRVETIGRKLDRYSRSRGYKAMAPDYLDRIHELLEKFDLRKRTEKLVRERESFDKWAAAQRDMGIEVNVPERLTLAGDKNFTRLTFDEIVALDDAVESLAQLGRQKSRLKVEKEERDLNDMVGQAVQTAQALPTRPWEAKRNRSKNIPRDLNAALVKMEFIADYLDDGDPNGVFNEMLVKGATRAANKLEELQTQVMDPLASLYLNLPAKEKRRFTERISVEEFASVNPETREVTPTTFMRSELIAVALNIGNKSNLEKMLEGESKAIEAILGERGADPHRWTKEKVMAVLNRHLNEDDWAFVETVWERVNSLWPDIVEAERELTGITPEKVEGMPVETRYGTIQGGYYPVVYDPNRSQMASDNADQEAADMFGAIGRFVGTPKGHTISRTGAAQPITFSLERVLFSHIKKVSTRVAYGRYVRDTLKFAAHPKIRALFDEHLGMEYHSQIKPWLREQVQDGAMDLKHIAAVDRILRQFRVNMTLVGLGFRFTTMFAQIAGWHNSQAEIGSKWLLRGVKETARNAGSIRSFVFERSGEMASRAQAFDRDVRAFHQQAAQGSRLEGDTWMDKLGRAGAAVGVPKLQGAAFWGIAMIDVYMVAMPTWLGAYHKALETRGMSEDEAIAFADKAVRKSQSAGRAKDLAALQRGPEGLRVLTTFYSYFNVLYNKQFETNTLVKRGREAGRRGNKALKFTHYKQAAMNVWWIMLIAPVTSALLTGDVPDEDEQDLEGWTSWAMNRIFFGLWAGVPGIRDVASKAQRSIEGEYAGSVTSPFFSAFEAAERPIGDLSKVVQGEEPSEKWLKNAITAPGYFLGLPTGQVASTTDYAVGVYKGDQKPDSAGQVMYGIMKGSQENQE